MILFIGNGYTTCFKTEFVFDPDLRFNDDNIKEIVYAKNMKMFASWNTGITNVDFLEDFTELESVCIVGNSLNPGIVIDHVPSLKNSPNLAYVDLRIDVDNLDFLAESHNLVNLLVSPYGAEIRDISGLRNKPYLKWLVREHIHCSEYSVLLDLPSLSFIHIDGSELPDEIKTALEEKGVEVKETPKEELQKEREEYEELVKSHHAQTD